MAEPLLTPLRRIAVPKGDVLHGMKASDTGFAGFGEAYLTQIEPGETKGWKRHFRMTLNLVCPLGAVRVVVRDAATGEAAVLDSVLSPDEPARYNRLTVPPGYWVAFHGAGPETSMLLNLASLEHDPAEAETVPLERFGWPVP